MYRVWKNYNGWGTQEDEDSEHQYGVHSCGKCFQVVSLAAPPSPAVSSQSRYSQDHTVSQSSMSMARPQTITTRRLNSSTSSFITSLQIFPKRTKLLFKQIWMPKLTQTLVLCLLILTLTAHPQGQSADLAPERQMKEEGDSWSWQGATDSALPTLSSQQVV